MKNYTVKLEIAMDVLVIGAKDEEHAQDIAMDEASLSNASLLGVLKCDEVSERELDIYRRHNEETIEA